MKKTIVLLLAVFTLFGCGKDLEFNTPAFQAKKDGNLWEAVTFTANVDTNTGVLTVLASDNFETISFQVFPNDAFTCDNEDDAYEGVYSSAIGSCYEIANNQSFGMLTDIDGNSFSTNNDPDPSIQFYPAEGTINVRELNLDESYVSGEFYFNAFNSSGLTLVNINEGFFHKIPLIGETIETPANITCEAAQSAVAVTLINFASASPGDANYAAVCNAYKTALTTQISACGDTDGTFQAIVDALTCE